MSAFAWAGAAVALLVAYPYVAGLATRRYAHRHELHQAGCRYLGNTDRVPALREASCTCGVPALVGLLWPAWLVLGAVLVVVAPLVRVVRAAFRLGRG